MSIFGRLKDMILKPEVKTVLSGNPLPPPQPVIEQMVAADARDEASRRRAEKVRQHLANRPAEPKEVVLPKDELIEEGETPQITALQGNFRQFMQSNPSQKMIEAWIKTHRVD